MAIAAGPDGIDELDLGVREYNCLHTANLLTIAELRDFLRNGHNLRKEVRNLGKISERRILMALGTCAIIAPEEWVGAA